MLVALPDSVRRRLRPSSCEGILSDDVVAVAAAAAAAAAATALIPPRPLNPPAAVAAAAAAAAAAALIGVVEPLLDCDSDEAKVNDWCSTLSLLAIILLMTLKISERVSLCVRRCAVRS